MSSKNEKPIIFNDEVVRAILGGTKTQTRRIFSDVATSMMLGMGIDAPDKINERCPYGQPGDHLWVRETFAHYGNGSVGREPVVAHVKYRADGASMDRGTWPDFDAAIHREWWNTGRFLWAPSIHMPRWASRINLEITGIRVEPVQEISSGDAIAEGVVPFDDEAEGRSPVYAFRELWDSANARRGCGWAENPWVWVVQFEVE